jgi:hypothetical protein
VGIGWTIDTLTPLVVDDIASVFSAYIHGCRRLGVDGKIHLGNTSQWFSQLNIKTIAFALF